MRIDAYLSGGRSLALRTTPGRTVAFRGGHSVVSHIPDAISLLRNPDVTLEIGPDQVDWISGWARSAGKVAATVNLPKGFSLGPAPDYELRRPGAVINIVEPKKSVRAEPAWEEPKPRKGRPRKTEIEDLDL